jgi:hypothetical protein
VPSCRLGRPSTQDLDHAPQAHQSPHTFKKDEAELLVHDGYDRQDARADEVGQGVREVSRSEPTEEVRRVSPKDGERSEDRDHLQQHIYPLR